MRRHYLFGPVSLHFANQNLAAERSAGHCSVFGTEPGLDLDLGPSDTWEKVCAKLPKDQPPEFLVLYMQYRAVPPWIWSAPVPIVTLAGDWNLLWHSYRQLRRSDLILTDAYGAELLQRDGMEQARSAILFGGEADFLEAVWPEQERDIDVLFVGNFNSAVQRERLAWLGRIAPLAQTRKVLFATSIYGDEYRKLLRRSRIIFNRGIRSEWNLRVTEALAAGALLFQEEGNREASPLLRDREECVYYNEENLESLIEHYLEYEDERRAIADQGQARVKEFSFDRFWQEQLAAIHAEWDSLVERSQKRARFDEKEQLLARAWQAYPATVASDPTLVADLRQFVETHPEYAEMQNALGCAIAVLDPQGSSHAAGEVLPIFQTAWGRHHVMAGLNVAEAYLELGQRQPAVEQARKVLQVLEDSSDLESRVLNSAHYPMDFDIFRAEWERAGWANAGDADTERQAKCDLLRWRLHFLLADLSDDVAHYEKAARIRPDLPTTQAALGCAMARQGRFTEAVAPLQRALSANPFDLQAARALYQLLSELGRASDREELAHSRRLLCQVAPQIVPREAWFQSPSSFKPLNANQFQGIFGHQDFSRAVHGFTVARDTEVVLGILAHVRPKRILEIGTAAGHMTANLTEWSSADAQIFSMGVVADLGIRTMDAQRHEDPPRSEFGRYANAFGKAYKVFFITADSLPYDFQRLAPLDFVFVDGAHDRAHVLSDSRKAYDALRPGGWMVWHDFNSPTPWVEVRQALEELRLSEPIYYVEGTEVAFLQKHGALREPVEKVVTPAADTVRGHSEADKFIIHWQGDHAVVHSLSLVNRAFCEGLQRHGHEVHIGPSSSAADFCIRQQWPPHFTPPASGHWIMMQPWEFGSLPREWAEIMATQVDELWVNTRYVQEVYLKSGVPADRVHLVPLGVDIERFHPQAPRFALQTTKRFKFLFVGGTIFRKGIDVLLDAYTAAFRRSDDVCLVIKDMGVGSFYKGQTAEARIAELQADPEAPEIEYLQQTLSSEELAGLYSACDCLAHPYRGEGFGLPIAEAMASGLCVIVTGMGAALDFCDESNAYLIPAERRYFGKNSVGDMDTVDTPWLAEPDANALRDLMRFVVQHPEEARLKAQKACEHIRSHFTWDHAVQAAERRLLELHRKPIRRLAPLAPPSSLQWAVAPQVSLCMIVKNEERMLPDCLRSIAGIFGQIVIVDTGSTDRTKEIAQSYGATVVDFKWIDSFAAARNESIRHATGKWILWLDADERLDEANRERLKQLLASLGNENVAYLMRQSSQLEHGPHAHTHVDQVRLFPNYPGLRWQYRVHEQILPGLRTFGADVRPTDIVIEHVGFEDPALQRPKVDRNLHLLKLEIEDSPDDTFVLYNLGAVAITQNRYEEAIEYLERCLNLSRPDDHLLAKVHSLIARGYQQLGKLPDALVACRHGRKAFPQDAELLFLEAVLLHERKDLPGAERALLQILDLPKNVTFAGSDSGLMSYRPRLFLADIYRSLDRPDDAARMLQAVVAECPSRLAAWRQLAEVYFEQSRWTEMSYAIERVRHDPEESLQATFILAQAHLARKEFDEAKALLESVIAAAPQAVVPKVYLSRVYLQEGKDWATAERVLRDVLALEPSNREALQNLQVLQQRMNAENPAAKEVKPSQDRPKQNESTGHAISTVPSRKKRKGQRMSVSLCMIVKDEEDNLPACIESVRDLVDEIIVIDTGSKDRTKEIALSYGAKVFDFPWIDHFAAARNESLKYATCEWIFWMDADDRLDDANRDKLRGLFASLEDENVGFVLKCLCLPDPETKTATEVDHLRLFRNRPDIRWKYRVHEQILPAIRKSNGEVRWSPVVIHHVGYQDAVVRQRKLQRDLRILLLDQAENPDDPFILFNLGAVYQEQNRQRDAIPLLWRSLELSSPTDSIVRKLYVLIAQCHNQLGDFQKSMTAIKQGQSVYPDDVELLFQEGVTLRHLGDVYGAVRAWEQVLKIPPGEHFASLNPGIRSYLTRQNLAIAYQDMQRFDQAEAEWRRIIADHPEYEPGLRGLAELALSTQRWHIVEEIARALEKQSDGLHGATILRGRVSLARKEFDDARRCFQRVKEGLPKALEPRVYLSYAYLQEGKDWVAAEHALRDILAIDPNHVEARHNLDVLLSQKKAH